jgi:hypothetical protein
VVDGNVGGGLFLRLGVVVIVVVDVWIWVLMGLHLTYLPSRVWEGGGGFGVVAEKLMYRPERGCCCCCCVRMGGQDRNGFGGERNDFRLGGVRAKSF